MKGLYKVTFPAGLAEEATLNAERSRQTEAVVAYKLPAAIDLFRRVVGAVPMYNYQPSSTHSQDCLAALTSSAACDVMAAQCSYLNVCEKLFVED